MKLFYIGIFVFENFYFRSGFGMKRKTKEQGNMSLYIIIKTSLIHKRK